MRGMVVWLQPECLGEIVKRLLVLSRLGVGKATHGQSSCIGWGEPQALVPVLNGPVKPPCDIIQGSAAFIGKVVRGVELNIVVPVLERLLESPLSAIRACPVEDGGSACWIELDCPTEVCDCLVEGARLNKSDRSVVLSRSRQRRRYCAVRVAWGHAGLSHVGPTENCGRGDNQHRQTEDGAAHIIPNGLFRHEGVHTPANDPAQAGRASDVRLPTERRSRPCLQPDGWVQLSWLVTEPLSSGKQKGERDASHKRT